MPANNEEHTRLLEEMVEQMKAHILSQDARILEQEQTIADLRSLVDDLRLLKAGLEETLEEFKRQLFGTKSEKTKTSQADAAVETEDPASKTTVKEHTRAKKKKQQGMNAMQTSLSVMSLYLSRTKTAAVRTAMRK